MILQGKAAWVFPDSFDVDYIIGIPNIGLTDLLQICQANVGNADEGL